MSTNSKQQSKPVFRKKLPNGISAAVFENEYEGRKYRSVNLQRAYRKDGNWKHMTLYLDHEHIPFVVEALQSSWQFLNDYPIGSIASDQPEESSGESDNSASLESAGEDSF